MMKKHISISALLTILLFSCEPQAEMIHAPEHQDPPFVVDVQYPESLPQELFSVSRNPKPYFPIIVRTLGLKPTHDWSSAVERKTRVIRNMVGYEPSIKTQKEYDSIVDLYGGCTTLPRQEATGRFRTQKINGRWWIINPDGYMEIFRGVTSFANPNPTTAEMEAVYGTEGNWVKMSARQLRSMGFHGVGAFCDDNPVLNYNESSSYLPLTQTPKPNFLSACISKGGYAKPENDNCRAGVVFNEDFGEIAKQVALENLSKYKGKSYILGVMSDNEIPFSAGGVDILQEMLSLEDDSFIGKIAAQKLLSDHGIEPNLNGYKKASGKDALKEEFAGQMAERYFKACGEAVKSVDPQMLYLGARLHGNPKVLKSVIQAAGRYCDIITINYYGDWTPALDGMVKNWEEWTDTPVMITEFYSAAENGGAPNATGAGFLVKTERDKAFFYQNFTLALLEAKNCVGWTWFRYIDNENANMGIYDSKFMVYPEVGTLARELNFNVYNLIDYFDN